MKYYHRNEIEKQKKTSKQIEIYNNKHLGRIENGERNQKACCQLSFIYIGKSS